MAGIVRPCIEQDAQVPELGEMNQLHDSGEVLREVECRNAVYSYNQKNNSDWKPRMPEVQADYHAHIRKPKYCWGSPSTSQTRKNSKSSLECADY